MSTLKKYIKDQGLSQQELANLVGLNQATVSKHLRGKGMRLETALKYNRILGVPLESLLSDDHKEQADD